MTPDSNQSRAKFPKATPEEFSESGDKTGLPAFKKWFGDYEQSGRSKFGSLLASAKAQLTGYKAPNESSQVVDDQGQPKIVYHGTMAKFEAFDNARTNKNSLFGPGHYFTEDQSVADGYTVGNAMREYREDEERSTPRLIKAHLNIRNPFDADWHIANVLKNPGMAKFSYDFISDALGGNEKATAKLKELGYDGITHIGGHVTGGNKHKVWIAFEPTQIKSTDNEGTYDPDDPRMHKAEGGEVQPVKPLSADSRSQQKLSRYIKEKRSDAKPPAEVPHKAEGGEVPEVPGIPREADEVPIKAQAGEVVIKNGPAQRYRQQLDAMNADQTPHFERGGEVDNAVPMALDASGTIGQPIPVATAASVPPTNGGFPKESVAPADRTPSDAENAMGRMKAEAEARADQYAKEGSEREAAWYRRQAEIHAVAQQRIADLPVAEVAPALPPETSPTASAPVDSPPERTFQKDAAAHQRRPDLPVAKSALPLPRETPAPSGEPGYTPFTDSTAAAQDSLGEANGGGNQAPPDRTGKSRWDRHKPISTQVVDKALKFLLPSIFAEEESSRDAHRDADDTETVLGGGDGKNDRSSQIMEILRQILDAVKGLGGETNGASGEGANPGTQKDGSFVPTLGHHSQSVQVPTRKAGDSAGVTELDKAKAGWRANS